MNACPVGLEDRTGWLIRLRRIAFLELEQKSVFFKGLVMGKMPFIV